MLCQPLYMGLSECDALRRILPSHVEIKESLDFGQVGFHSPFRVLCLYDLLWVLVIDTLNMLDFLDEEEETMNMEGIFHDRLLQCDV